MVRVHSIHFSGNCYKVRLALTQLGVPYEVVEMDLSKGATKSEEFLAINPSGKTPTAVLDDGRVLTESNAIISYFAEGSDLLPSDPFERAQVNQWLFWEQFHHVIHVATARVSMKILGKTPETDPRLPTLWENGYKAFDIMEQHLTQNDFFVGGRYSVADISLYAYTHLAHEGGFDLGKYPNIQAWIKRVASQKGYAEITEI